MGNVKGIKRGTHLAGANGSTGPRGGQRGIKGSSSALVGSGSHTAQDEVSIHAEDNNGTLLFDRGIFPLESQIFHEAVSLIVEKDQPSTGSLYI